MKVFGYYWSVLLLGPLYLGFPALCHILLLAVETVCRLPPWKQAQTLPNATQPIRKSIHTAKSLQLLNKWCDFDILKDLEYSKPLFYYWRNHSSPCWLVGDVKLWVYKTDINITWRYSNHPSGEGCNQTLTTKLLRQELVDNQSVMEVVLRENCLV